MPMEDRPLLIVSNRGPIRFMQGTDGSRIARRGGGGLVTALSALTNQRALTWVASALSDDDLEVAEEGAYVDGNLRLRLVAHDREEYDRYYNVFANPTLWFIQHYLWGLSYAPSVDRNIRLGWDAGYLPVNERFAEAVCAEIDAQADGPPLVMVHDYQLYLVPQARLEANAFYSREHNAVLFGWLPAIPNQPALFTAMEGNRTFSPFTAT